MRFVSTSLFSAALVLAVTAPAHAQTGISFSKEIVPIFREACAKCHSARNPQGGLSLVSYAGLVKGGKGGKVLAPKGADSRLVKYLDGTLKPVMPIGGSLKKEQIARISAWVDAGAKADVPPDQVVISETAIPVVRVPKIALKVPMLPEITALGWSKDGKILAIGGYKTVRLVDPATGQTIKELGGCADKVHSVAFSPDGKMLAASGGPPSQMGEIVIWNVPGGDLVRRINGHADFIYSISWSPDNKNIASASYDKLAKIWDITSGAEVKTLKDHADAVYAIAYNPAGTLIATGSADRSVKVWDVASGKRIYTLAGHTDTVFSLAWNVAGNQLTSAGADKVLRTWNVNASAGQAARNTTAHDKTIQEVVYSPDGALMCSVSDDHTAKIWNAANGGAIVTIKDQPDALLSAAFSGDNKLVAIGGFDGTVKIFDAKDGKLLSTIIDLPKPAPKPAAPAPPAGTVSPPTKPDPKKPVEKPGAKK